MARLAELLPLARNASLVLAAAVAQLVWAGPPAKPATPLNDPMRPQGASAATAPRPVSAGAGPGANPSASPAAPEPAEVLPRLQATRRSDQGVWVALIDDRWRSVGERHGDSVVASIRAGDVVLTHGSQRTTITLLEARSTPSKTNLDKP